MSATRSGGWQGDRVDVVTIGRGPGGEAAAGQPRPEFDVRDEVTVWTNRQGATVRDIASRVLLVGGSAVGVELGQFFARLGAQVTIVQSAGTLVDREAPRVGELAREALAAVGV